MEPTEEAPGARRRTARLAGLWYLAMAVSGPIGIVYVPSKILVVGDAEATAANILAHGPLMRLGIVSSVVCQVSFVFLVLGLQRLLRSINASHSKLMVSLVVAAVPLAIGNELFQVAALEVGSRAQHLGGLAAESRNALALAFATVHKQGISLAGFFWGLWLFPFGLLVIRSGFIPKVLGILLLVSGASYLIESSVAFLIPQHLSVVSNVLSLPMAAGELSMVLWLLIKGVRTEGSSDPRR